MRRAWVHDSLSGVGDCLGTGTRRDRPGLEQRPQFPSRLRPPRVVLLGWNGLKERVARDHQRRRRLLVVPPS